MTQEKAVIALFDRSRKTNDVQVGIGDDGAVLRDGTVLTVDTMVEGVHWDDKLTPEDVGWKLVAVNVSDLGAMGAKPAWALLAMALPSPLDMTWTERFREGLFEALNFYDLPLIGGDTVSGPTRTLTLTVGGKAAHPVLRSTGKPGDDVYITGELGLAAAGFLDPAPTPAARAALCRPTPPVRFGVALAESGLVTAMMDLSDGLREDLATLCRASSVGAEIDPAQVPGAADLAHRFSFGEDYQLLFTAPPDARSAVESLSRSQAVPIARIGRLTAGGPVRLLGASWPAPLYTHFPPGPR